MIRLARLGTYYDFDNCDPLETIKGLNYNSLLIEILSGLSYEEVSELPVSPTDGQTVIVDGSPNIYYWIDQAGDWAEIVPDDRIIGYNETQSTYYAFDGSDWIPFSSPSVIEAQGDIIRGDAAGEEERLPLGTEGQVLKSVSGQAVWSDEDPISFFPNITINVEGTEDLEEDQKNAIENAYAVQFPELASQFPVLGSAQELKVVGTYYDTITELRSDYVWDGSVFVPIEYLRPASDLSLNSSIIFAQYRTNYREFVDDTLLTVNGLKEGFTTICAVRNTGATDIEVYAPTGSFVSPDYDPIIPPDTISVFTFVRVGGTILVAVVSGMESV